jgi:AAA domain, putative AbiEii toxin, Type IV TA system
LGHGFASLPAKMALENLPSWKRLPLTTASDQKVAIETSRMTAPRVITPSIRSCGHSAFRSISGPGRDIFYEPRAGLTPSRTWNSLDISAFYGGQSLHARSHGEAFFTLLDLKFRRNGLFLPDEPEAALSPQRQLSFLVLMHDVLKKYKDAQFIISTHSPVLLGYPKAEILSFDDGRIHRIEYDETIPTRIVRRFVNDREGFLDELPNEGPSLFNPDNAG